MKGIEFLRSSLETIGKEYFMKKKNVKNLMYFLSICAIFGLPFAGCTNTEGSDAPPAAIIPADDPDTSYTVTGIQISPKIPYVVKGGKLQFQAKVTGQYTDTGNPIPQGKAVVYWELEGLEGQIKNDNSRIDSKGLLAIAGKEDLTALQVTVRSVRDPKISDSAIVVIYGEKAWLPVVGAVTVDPPAPTLQKGNEMNFTSSITWANKMADDDPAEDVYWSIDETGLNKYTTVGSTGLLVVPVDELRTTLTVRATSLVDPDKSGTAVVTLTPPPIMLPQNVLSYSGDTTYLVWSPGMGTPRAMYDERTLMGGWLEITMQYKAIGGDRVLGITTNDSPEAYGEGITNEGMPVEWFIDGISAWLVNGLEAQEIFGTGHGYCNKRVFLSGTGGNWRTVKLEFDTEDYYWYWAREPLFLLFYFNPENESGVQVQINYVTIRKLGAGLGSPYIVVPNFLPSGDFNGSMDGWRNIEPPVDIESVNAPFVPGWFYNPDLYNNQE